jgi:hypothetical protein
MKYYFGRQYRTHNCKPVEYQGFYFASSYILNLETRLSKRNGIKLITLQSFISG